MNDRLAVLTEGQLQQYVSLEEAIEILENNPENRDGGAQPHDIVEVEDLDLERGNIDFTYRLLDELRERGV